MSDTERLPTGRIDVDKPRWDQRMFVGRLKHFAWITDFRNALVLTGRLHESKHLLQMYRYDQNCSVKLFFSVFVVIIVICSG